MRARRHLAAALALALGLALAVGLAGAVGQARAQAASQFEQLVDRRVAAEAVPLCVAVARVSAAGTETAVRCASAMAPRLTAQSVLEIGSLSKVFLGVLLADSVARGELRLDDPLARYLPAGSTVPEVDGRVITLRDLATHRSGLPRLPPGFNPRSRTDPYAELSVEQLLAALAATQLDASPGSRYAYSNFGAMLLSYALGRAAGQPFDVMLRERITAPLGMHSTVAARAASLAQPQAQGHGPAGAPVAAWNVDPQLAGVGMIRSTLQDMQRFLQAAVRPGDDALGRALRESQAPLQEAESGRGIGLFWQRSRAPSGRAMVEHNGATGGFTSMLALDPERGVGAVVLVDTQRNLDDLARHLVDPSASLKQPRPRLQPDAPTIDQLVGVYRLAPGFDLTLTRRGQALYVQATGQPAFEVFFEAPDRIYWTVVEASAQFERDADGKAGAMLFTQAGRTTRAERQLQ